MIVLKPEPLTKAAFAPFGEVVEMEGARQISTNQGFGVRFNDLARIDVVAEGGAVNVSFFTANPRPMPVAVTMMERHPIASQMFFPLQDRDWLVLVAGEFGDDKSFRAFRANGRQGINYARNVWHFPLLVFDAGSRFLVVDRKGPGDNLEEVWLPESRKIVLSP